MEKNSIIAILLSCSTHQFMLKYVHESTMREHNNNNNLKVFNKLPNNHKKVLLHSTSD